MAAPEDAVEVHEDLVVTCSAPTNIAVIKYWGKDNVALNTPINSSVSVTLNQDDLSAITTVAASKQFTADRLWLNGREEDVAGNKRILACLRELRALAGDRRDSKGEVLVRAAEWKDYRLHIVSRNTFPTAAGLASSAAGYAALVFTIAELLCVEEKYPGQLTAIARQGSGSACRSLYGGFVKWQKGTGKEDASDSIAVQVAEQKHWPDIEALICVVSDAKKSTSSTSGMSRSVETSPLLAFRAKSVVDSRLSEMEEAYKRRDFQTFGRLTMQDSNQFHATCLDTYPPIFYMNDISKFIIQLVHAYNEFYGEIRAAYTFDAGPNAVVFTLKQHTAHLLAYLLHFLPPPQHTTEQSSKRVEAYVNHTDLWEEARKNVDLSEDLLKATKVESLPEGVRNIYHTTVGDGPRRLPTTENMIDLSTGLPKAFTQ